MLTAELITETKLAQVLGVSIQKLQRDRWAGRGIPYIKVGRCVRYRPEAVDAYLESRTRTSTTQQAARP